MEAYKLTIIENNALDFGKIVNKVIAYTGNIKIRSFTAISI